MIELKELDELVRVFPDSLDVVWTRGVDETTRRVELNFPSFSENIRNSKSHIDVLDELSQPGLLT